MDLLGIGPLEVFFILIIALIIFGPNDLARAGRSVGRFLRKVVTSEGYRAIRQVSKEVKNLPNTLMREAGLEEAELRKMTGMADFQESTREIQKQMIAPSEWVARPHPTGDPPQIPGGQPPSEADAAPEDESAPGSPFSQNLNSK